MSRFIIKTFLFVQLILILAWFFGGKYIFLRPTFTGTELVELNSVSFLWSRANFDGVRYVQIARDGYGYLQEAFFPFYPQLIAFFKNFFGYFTPAGIFVSLTSFILALIVLSKLLSFEKIKEGRIRKIILVLAFFPTAYYFSVVYTESLFLLLVLLSFYLSKQKKYLLAGMVAGLASYTRLVGIFLIPALIIDYCSQENCNFSGSIKDKLRKAFKALCFSSISSWGLFAYMYFLKRTTGDYFYFAHVQQGFGAGRTTEKLILIYQVFWRYVKMIFTVNPNQWAFYYVLLEFIISAAFLSLIVWGWYKRKEYKIRDSWLVFSTLAFILPTLTGTFSSMPRYVLVCFPCFVVIERLLSSTKKKNKILGCLCKYYLPISLLLLLILSAFFFQGYWVG